jgi:hypothetical protein
MDCKVDKIRVAWASGDQIAALRSAARFFDLSRATQVFKRAINAYNNPRFYRQLGKQPDELIAIALELLAKKFRL